MEISWVINIDCSTTFFLKSVCKFCGEGPQVLGRSKIKISNSYKDILKEVTNKIGPSSIFNLPSAAADKQCLRYINIHKSCNVTNRIKRMNKGSMKEQAYVRPRMTLNNSLPKNSSRKVNFFGSDLLTTWHLLTCNCLGTFWVLPDNVQVSTKRGKHILKTKTLGTFKDV